MIFGSVNFNMFHGPCHSKASGPDTYNIYSCLQHLAEASLRDWWVGSACGTPFVPLSRGRLISRAVDSIFAFERRLGHFIPRSAGKRERGRSSEDCISCCGYLSEPHSEIIYIIIYICVYAITSTYIYRTSNR